MGRRYPRQRHEFNRFIASGQTALVAQNSSSNRPGEVKYPSVDLRTAEHFHFIYRERRLVPGGSAPATDYSQLPLEYCTTLTPDWFWSEEQCLAKQVTHAMRILEAAAEYGFDPMPDDP